MPDDKNINLILEKFYNRYNQFNTKVLKKMGESVKQFDGLTPSQAHILAQELKYGQDMDNLLNELSQISGKSAQELEQIIEEVAKTNTEFAEVYYKAKNKEFIKYEDNKPLQRLVNGLKNDSDEMFKNISNSTNIGFTYKDAQGNVVFRQLKDVYNDLIDEVDINVSMGVQDYQSAIRNTINGLADSGVKIHEEKLSYASGYNRRLDSSIRQNVLSTLRLTNISIQAQVGEDFGADGIEISAHSPCAEDHLHINGRQYKAKRGETTEQLLDRINSTLNRPIGWYNCRHFVFSIVYGVNKPEYSKRELNKMEKESLSKVEYEGDTYTKYEATQVQRKLETEIRRQKDRQIINKASGNKDEMYKAQNKIDILTRKYNDFSKSANLPTYKQNLTVTGYHRVKVK